MIRNVLALSVIVTALAVIWGVAGPPLSSPANAIEHGATRSLSPATVAPGGEVVVTLMVTGVGGFGGVVETLPDGFTYVSSGHAGVVEEGQNLTFPLLSQDSATITYTVTASTEEKAHSFSGTVRNDQGVVVAVTGAQEVTVRAEPKPEPSEHGATRSFSPATVAPGGEVVVTLMVTGVGGFGGVVETLPDGFTYVSSGHAGVVEEGQNLTFPLLSQDNATITYTVTASTEEKAHSFSGTVRNDQGVVVAVAGAQEVTVRAEPKPEPSEHGATRSFSPATVAPGGEVVVTLMVTGVGGFGGVAETLPDGFTYVSSGHAGVLEEGQNLTFPLLSQDSATITYTVTASTEEKAHSFSGTVRNDQGVVVVVTGASSVTVATPAPPPAPKPTRRVSTGGGGGSGGGVTAPPLATVAPTATPEPEPTATPEETATPEPTPEATPEEPAVTSEATPEEPAVTSEPTVQLGQPGPTGLSGPTGEPGADGKDGADGRAGTLGRAGADGSDGADGASGQDGTDGAAGQDGNDGADGRGAASGAKGAKGDTGSQGGAGTAGAGGASGADGSGGGPLGIIVLIISIVALVAVGGVLVLGRRG